MRLQWYCTTVAEAAYEEFLKLGYSHDYHKPKSVWTESTGHHYVVVRDGGREYIVDLWTIGLGQEHRIAPIARVWDAKDPALLQDASYERQVLENPTWQNPVEGDAAFCDGVGCEEVVALKDFNAARWQKRRDQDGEVIFLCPKCYDDYLHTKFSGMIP